MKMQNQNCRLSVHPTQGGRKERQQTNLRHTSQPCHHSRAITGKDHEHDTQCFPVLSPPETRSNRTISTNDESATVAPATADAATVPSAIPNQPADPIYFQVHFQVGQKAPSADHKTSRKGILQRKRCDQRGKIKQQGAIHFRPEEKARTGRSRFGGIQGELYRCACSLRLLTFLWYCIRICTSVDQ